MVTDVKGATVSIEARRYKDVHTLGAATITAIQNVMGGTALPFVFGGDGATALISGPKKDAVE